jgi:hypothetical protein
MKRKLKNQKFLSLFTMKSLAQCAKMTVELSVSCISASFAMRSTSAKIVKKNPITITLLFKLKKLEELSKDSKLFKNIAKKFLTSQNKENL